MSGGKDTVPETAMPHSLIMAMPETVNRRLYSIPQIFGATLLGTPLAGCWLMAQNYRAIGRQVYARLSLIFGAISTLGVFVLAAVLPDNTPNAFVPSLYIAMVGGIASVTQGDWLQQHFDGGWARQSNWNVFGIGIAWLVALTLILAATIFVIPESIWRSIQGVA